MANMEIKNIASVDVIEEASGEEKLLVESNGVIRRLPSSNFSGGGGVGIDIIGSLTIPEEGGDPSDPSTWALEITCPYSFSELQALREERPIDAIITYPKVEGGVMYLRPFADATTYADVYIQYYSQLLPESAQGKSEYVLLGLGLLGEQTAMLVLYEDTTDPQNPILGAAVIFMDD